MKRLFLTGVLIAIAVNLLCQAPHAFNYQAILRNSDGTVKANESLGLQISLIDDNGSSAYMETHNTQTSELGLVNVVIGQGTTSGDFSMMNWSDGPYFIDISVNGENLGSSPLLNVPYALYPELTGGGEDVVARAMFQDSISWFNVLNYGAVADHSTDNTVAFQAAIDACAAAGGGEVYVPAASNYYDVDGMLRVQTDNIKIRGGGMYSSKIFFTDGNSDDVGFWFTKSGDTQLNNSGLEDLQIWIDDYDLIAARFTVTIWGFVRRCNIRNISGLTDNSTAVSFKGKSNLGWSGGNIIDRCEITDVHTGVYIDSISNNNFIINSWISGNTNKFSGSAALKIVDGGDQSDSQFISGCNFENVERGILVDAVGARILGCRFEGVDTAIHVAQINAHLTTAFNVYSDVSEEVYSDGNDAQRYVSVFESAKLELSGSGSLQPEIKLGTSSGTEAGSMIFMNANESNTESALELRAYGGETVADVFETEAANRGVISSDYKLKFGTVYNSDIEFFTNGIRRVWIDGGGGLVLEPSSAVDAVTGAIRFDSEDGHFWGYNGSAWVQLDN